MSFLAQFECLCIACTPISHIISVLHIMLTAVTPSTKPAHIRALKCDLQCHLFEVQLQHLYRLTRSSFIDSKTQENNDKFLTRCYQGPAALAHIYTSLSDLCWRNWTAWYAPPYLVGMLQNHCLLDRH